VNSKLKFFSFIVSLIIFSNCSFNNENILFEGNNLSDEPIVSVDRKTYIDQLKLFGRLLSSSSNVRVTKFNKNQNDYLISIIKHLYRGNENTLIENFEWDFFIIESSMPFHFSLPGGQFYFSRAILNNYIKNEGFLSSIISFDLLRTSHNLYKKNLIIPKGYITLEKMVKYLHIDVEEKLEIHKWAYHLQKRSGLYQDSYLSWLQIQNKNSGEFEFHNGNLKGISQEEFQFKRFLINKGFNAPSLQNVRNSSSKFYEFLNSI
jgi:hypothetical protein